MAAMLNIQENSRKLRKDLLPALEEQLLQFREATKQANIEQQDRVEHHLQELKHKVAQLTSLVNLEQSSLSALQEENHQLEDLIAVDRKLLESQRKSRVVKEKKEPAEDLRMQELLAKDLRRAVQSYERGLGLSLRRLPDHGLKLSFSQICRGREDLEHTCIIQVQGDIYEVTHCEPHLDALPNLVAQLNASNHFGAFVRGLRREFCRLYT